MEPETVGLTRNERFARAITAVDYIFFVIYGLIALEIFLELAAAREGNAFKSFMDVITFPFLAPFIGLFRDPAIGDSRVMFSYFAALIVWVLVHLGVRGLLRVVAQRKTVS